MDKFEAQSGNDTTINAQKTILLLCLFLLVIVALQVSKMGILQNNALFTQPEAAAVKAISSQAVGSNSHQIGKIALIFDQSADDREYIYLNFKNLLDKYALAYDCISASQSAVLDDYAMLIVLVGNYENAPILQSVFDSVEQGKTAYFPIVAQDSDSFLSVSGSLGVIEKSSKLECSSITDLGAMLSDAAATYELLEPIPLQYFLRLRKDCEVLFCDESKNPLLWKRKLGNGSLYISNCDYLSSYASRGVIAEILYETLKQSADLSMLYPLYATGTLLLEEFPSGFTISSSEILNQEKMTYDKFIETHFWPMLTRLTRNFDLKTTISYCISYDDNTEENFEISAFSSNDLKIYAAEILQSGGELALHGYNMRPLGLPGELTENGWFIPWQSIESIKTAFQLALTPAKALFPNYRITTYVPPQGRISDPVLALLPSIDPDLKVIAVPYDRNTQDQAVYDFQPDSNQNFHYMLLSGLNGLTWQTLNSLKALGFASLSLNINQILQNSDLSFAELSQALTDVYALIASFPAIRQTTISGAAQQIQAVQAMQFSYSETEESISLHVSHGFEGMTFALRTKSRITSGDGYTAATFGDDFYVLVLDKPDIIILK